VAPIRDEGGVTRYFMAVQRDVTEQKRIEMLAASASLVDNLGYLVAGVRHELSGPIDTLRTNLSVLRAGWEAASPEEMTSALDGMLDEVRRVEEFLKALRSLDVFDQVNLAGLPLARFLDGFAQQTQEEMARRGVQFSWRSPGSPIVLADPQALHQVLLNLCANRIAALDGVPQASLDIEVSERGDLVVLRIKDNAPGMSDRQLAALFQPFQEHRQGDVRLGLVVVRKLISKMRGTLRVESATDAGTTVTISLERVSS
jgi:C4-dicarboxylate-specific signal transduction histidine kinase